jgi:hypothetical protein
VIVGNYVDLGGVNHGSLRAPDGRITTFDFPGAATGTGQGTVGADINPGGETVGYYFDVNFVAHGFVRSPRGKFTSFDAPGAGSAPGTSSSTWYQGTQAAAIHSDGAITGYYTDAHNVIHGFLRLAVP